MSEILRIEALTKSFSTTRAVDDVSLTIKGDEMIGIIGRSGAGKSTLLRLINRLADPTSGSIHFGDRDITALQGRALRQWRAECGMIFQQFNLAGRLDALTNVLIGRASKNSTLSNMVLHFPATDRADAIALMDRLGVLGVALQRAETLSGGQQQRVAIARTMMQGPRIILADEPVAALDPQSAEQVMGILATINKTQGIGIIVNLHSLDIARRYFPRIIGLREGQVVFDGTPNDLTEATLLDIYGPEGIEDAE